MTYNFFADIPDAPQSLEIHDVSSRSVRLSWKKPFDGNFPITRYTIMWRQVNGKYFRYILITISLKELNYFM